MNFLYPVSPWAANVTQTFAEHKANAPKLNAGLDLAPPWGNTQIVPVTAAQAGKVKASGWNNGGYGNRVLIDHGGGIETLYAHLETVAVAVGDVVEAGAYLGDMGSTGNSSGKHLHFEIRKGGIPIDPAPLLAQAQTPEPTQPPAMTGQVQIAPGYNLRAAPEKVNNILGQTVVTGAGAKVLGTSGDWVQIECWIHKDGIA